MGSSTSVFLGLGATLLALAALLASAPVHAQTCPEGEACAIDVHAGRCTELASGEVVCLADPVQGCQGFTSGTPCPVLEEADGLCQVSDEVMTCVPNATDPSCDGRRLDDTCVRDDGLEGTCRPDRAVLACVPDPCALAEVDADCVDADGVSGFCRDVGGDALVCTAACTQDGSRCSTPHGFEGVCEPWLDDGSFDCVDPTSCFEGDECITSGGEEGRCVVTGGDGSTTCRSEAEIAAAEDESLGGCCIQDRNPSMAALRREALGALGLGIAAIVARRRRRPSPGKAAGQAADDSG